MPFRKKRSFKKKRRFTKKRSKKGGRKAAQSMVLKRLARQKVVIFHDPNKSCSAFPSQYFTTMLFQASFLRAETATFHVENFTPNVLDKMVNATSDPAHEFAVLNSLYRRYVVLAVDYRITFTNLTTNAIQIAVIPWPHADTPVGNQDAATREGSRILDLQAVGATHAWKKLSGHINIGKLFGVKHVTVQEDFWGMNAISPDFIPRLYVATTNQQAVSSINYIADVTFRLYCKWFDRKDQETADGISVGIKNRPTWKDRNIKRYVGPASSAVLEDIDEIYEVSEPVVKRSAPPRKRRVIRPTKVVREEKEDDFEMECL